ncbi:MAG: FecR domain-containing protein [Proteobacteria bacterium]|nr:FecR domain-containing protein [Pseudomonadota bacterium]
MKRIVWLLPTLLLAILQIASAGEKFGEAWIREGSMKLSHQGETSVYSESEWPVDIFVQDVLQVGENSRVSVKTTEATELELGANAVFQVRPWRLKKRKGATRLLFGKTRIRTPKKRGRRPFRIRTASAAVGVRGTDFFMNATPRGNTSLMTRESIVEIQGLKGDAQQVKSGDVSVVLSGRAATPPVAVPPSVQRSVSRGGLNSPRLGSRQSLSMVGEKGLIAAGVISQKDLDRVNQGTIEGDSGGDSAVSQEPDTEEIRAKALKTWRMKIKIEK